MRFKALFTSALALLALALLPAGASAAGTISGGPAKVKGGYTIFLAGSDAKKDQLTIVISRGNERNGSSETLVFTRGVRVVVGGGKGSIKGTLGSRGNVKLDLENARVERKRKQSDRCKGKSAVTRTGRLVGKLRLRLPNGKFVVVNSLPGSTFVGGNVTCEPESDNRPAGDGEGGDADGKDDRARLVLSIQKPDAMTSFMATRKSMTLFRSSPPRKDRGTTVTAIQMAMATGSNLLAIQDGGARATVKSAGPFTGTGLFTAASNFGTIATGPLSGNLRVKLGGVPVIAIAGENAMLLNANSPR